MLNDFSRFKLSNHIGLGSIRSLSALMHDILAAILAWWMAFLFRFNFDIPSGFIETMLESAIWVIPLQASIFLLGGLYRGVWRFASLPDLQRILKAIGVATFLVATILYMFKPHGVVPRSVLIMNPILLLMMMGGSRFLYRYWKEHKLYGPTSRSGKPVLVLGDGEIAATLLKDLAKSEEWRIVGLLSDDKTMHGRELVGVKVFGSIEQLPQLAARLDIRHVIVAMPALSHSARRLLLDQTKAAGVQVLTVPAFDDLMSGKVSVSQIRRVDVEDLLGRDPVKLDDEGLHDMLDGKVVMVTGAGGSIGSELCRQIIKYKPAVLLCFDSSEYALYRLEQEFSMSHGNTKIKYIVGDVKNEKRVKHLLHQYQPSSVFHAAAYKHVPMMENGNVAEALTNNVVGTHAVAKACKDAGVEKFVLVSTDKAVNPTNVMGASKRLAEMVCQGLQDKSGTRFVIVRFGNVLGSSGSVIPKFREQLEAGGPLTVTHPEITRYFMSIPEATQLVMQAGLMGTGAEIFVLDMGEPVKIADLAMDMIRLSGFNENEIEVQYTGLRPGEKLYEELLADDEHTLPTPHEKLRIAVARSTDKAWVKALLKWIETTVGAEESTVKQELKMWVEEYMGDIHAGKEAAAQLAPRSSTIH